MYAKCIILHMRNYPTAFEGNHVNKVQYADRAEVLGCYNIVAVMCKKMNLHLHTSPACMEMLIAKNESLF